MRLLLWLTMQSLATDGRACRMPDPQRVWPDGRSLALVREEWRGGGARSFDTPGTPRNVLDLRQIALHPVHKAMRLVMLLGVGFRHSINGAPQTQTGGHLAHTDLTMSGRKR